MNKQPKWELSHSIVMRQFNSGNPECFSYIYDSFQPTVYLFIKSILQNKEDALDVTTESFVSMWKGKFVFQSVENIRAFLFITARNKSLDFIKFKKRENNKFNNYNYDRGLNAYESIYEDQEVKAMVLKLVAHAINDLPDKCGKMFKMHYLDGLKTDQIASIMCVSEHTVRNQRTRAIQLLRISLPDESGLLMAIIMGFFFADN